MKEKKYAAANHTDAETIAEFSLDSNPNALHREVALCRHLLNSALVQNDRTAANNLLATLCKLIRESERAAIRTNFYLSRPECMEMLEKIIGLMQPIFHQLPNWQEQQLEFAEKIGRLVDEQTVAESSKVAMLRLTDARQGDPNFEG